MSTNTMNATIRSIAINSFLEGDFETLEGMDFDPSEIARDENDRIVLEYILDRTDSGFDAIPEDEADRKHKASYDRSRLGFDVDADEQTHALRSLSDPVDRTETSRYGQASRKEHIGWVILDEDEHYHKADYETAAWYTDYAISAGAYPVYLNTSHSRVYFYVDNAIVTDEHFPSLFGGVSISTRPLDKPNVGKTTAILRGLPDPYMMPIYREGVKLGVNRRLVLLDGIEMHASLSVLPESKYSEACAHRSNHIVLETGESFR